MRIDDSNEAFFECKELTSFSSKLVEPLDQLAAWAIEKFSDVKNLDIKPPANTNPPWTSGDLLVWIHFLAITEFSITLVKILLTMFSLPMVLENYLRQACQGYSFIGD